MKLIGLVALALMSLPAFSQTCYVDLVQTNSGRVLRSFTAYGDASSCVEGMKECRKAIRFDYSANPQYPASSLDCVRVGGNVPGPSNPYPQNPGPSNPYPGQYGGIESNALIIDVSNVIASVEVKTKVIESMVVSLNTYSMRPLVTLCSNTRTWNENASCLIDGLRRAPRELTDEHSAISAVGRACVITTSWNDEAACFSAAIRGNRLPSLSYLAPSCQQMYGIESQARCYRQVFGVR